MKYVGSSFKTAPFTQEKNSTFGDDDGCWALRKTYRQHLYTSYNHIHI